MSDAFWLMFATAVAWIGIGVYLLYLSRRATALEIRLNDLEKEMAELDKTQEKAVNITSSYTSDDDAH